MVLVFKIVLSRTFDDRYTWYMPSDVEVVNATVHRSDARKGRLHKRFGNPALTDDLFTPMIHKESQYLLPQIYRGRMAEDDYISAYETDKGPATNVAGNITQTGGITFQAVAPENLEMSRAEYLRAQEAWETGSTSTAAAGLDAMGRGDAAQALFESKKRQYMTHGPSQPGTPMTEQPYRFGGDSVDHSTENLLHHGRQRSEQLYNAQGRVPWQDPYNTGMRSATTAPGEHDFEDIGMQYPGARRSGYFEPSYGQQPRGAPVYQQVHAADSAYALPPGAVHGATGYGTPAPSYEYPPSQGNSPDMGRNAAMSGHRHNMSGGSQLSYGSGSRPYR